MIKVIVTNTTQASELIEAFSDKDYDVEIVVKENIVGQDDVISYEVDGSPTLIISEKRIDLIFKDDITNFTKD